MDLATSIKIDASLMERLRDYKAKTGISVSHCINEAVRDYLEVVVPARLEAMGISQNEKKNVTAAKQKRRGAS